MSTTGVIQLLYTAETGGLLNANNQVLKEMDRLEKKRKEVTRNTLAGIAAGVGGALAGLGLSAWVKGSMDAVNSTRALAEQLGTSTEALSELQYAASLADVDAETLAGSLQKMEQRLGEIAITGEGKAAGMLRNLGADAQALANADPADAFRQLVGLLGQVQNPAERMKAAVDIFGKSAAGILNLAVQGEEGLAAMTEEAGALGASISDIDAALIDEADDSMTKLWASISAVGKELAVGVAPWLTAAANAFVDFAKRGIDGSSLVSQALDWVSTGIGYIGDGLQLLSMAWHGMQGLVNAIISGWLYMIDLTIKGVTKLASYLTGTDIVATDFVKNMADDLSLKASAEFKKVGEIWGQEWAHETVRKFVDETKSGALSRASDAVAAAGKYRGGQAVEIGGGKGGGKLASAALIGSQEAANAILRGMGGAKNEKLTKVEENTRKTAAFTERMLKAMETADKTGLSDLDVWEMST